MYSKQAKTIEFEIDCRQAKLPNMVTICTKNVCDTISTNIKLMLINAETNAALNLRGETVFFTPKIQSMAAMYL